MITDGWLSKGDGVELHASDTSALLANPPARIPSISATFPQRSTIRIEAGSPLTPGDLQVRRHRDLWKKSLTVSLLFLRAALARETW
jgi:hypothetical protein